MCYGSEGHLAEISRRAVDGLAASLNAAALACHVAALHGTVARLHVTGDFCYQGDLDIPYLVGLEEIGRDVQRHYGTRWVAWAYEHLSEEQRFRFAPWRERLFEAGMVIRLSDYFGPGGAVIMPHSEVSRARKETGLGLFKCPAQCVADHSVTCRTCTLCWTREDLVVAFAAHTNHWKEIYRRTSNPYVGCLTSK